MFKALLAPSIPEEPQDVASAWRHLMEPWPRSCLCGCAFRASKQPGCKARGQAA